MTPINAVGLIHGCLCNNVEVFPKWDESRNALPINIADREYLIGGNDDVHDVLCQIGIDHICIWCNNCLHMTRGGMMLEGGCTMCYCKYGISETPCRANHSHLYWRCSKWSPIQSDR
jgi:hypothetical protein